jgi:hypothetical protein
MVLFGITLLEFSKQKRIWAAFVLIIFGISLIGLSVTASGVTFDSSAVVDFYEESVALYVDNVLQTSLGSYSAPAIAKTGKQVKYVINYEFKHHDDIEGYYNAEYNIRIYGGALSIGNLSVAGTGPFAQAIASTTLPTLGNLPGYTYGAAYVDIPIRFGYSAQNIATINTSNVSSTGSIILTMTMRGAGDYSYNVSMSDRSDSNAYMIQSLTSMYIDHSLSFSAEEKDDPESPGQSSSGIATSYEVNSNFDGSAWKKYFTVNSNHTVDVDVTTTSNSSTGVAIAEFDITELGYGDAPVVGTDYSGLLYRDMKTIVITVPTGFIGAVPQQRTSSGNWSGFVSGTYAGSTAWDSNVITLPIDDSPDGIRKIRLIKEGISAVEAQTLVGQTVSYSLSMAYKTTTTTTVNDSIQSVTGNSTFLGSSGGSTESVYTISGFAFYDANNNGLRDIGELAARPESVIIRNVGNSNVLHTVIPDSIGYWVSGSIVEGTSVRVEYANIQNYSFSTATVGDAASKVNSSGMVTAIVNSNLSYLNAGYVLNVSTPGMQGYSGVLYYDMDYDSVRDANEPVLQYSAQMQTSTTGDGGWINSGSAITGVGAYNFVAPENLYVRFLFTVNSNISSSAVSIVPTGQPQQAQSGTIIVNSPVQPTGSVYQPLTFRGKLFLDSNGNDTPEVAEYVIGAVVKLTDSGGNVLVSGVTDANGEYNLGIVPLANGIYGLSVEVNGQAWTIVTPANQSYTITNYTPPASLAYIEVAAPSGALGSISGRAWLDSDGDGLRNETSPIVGVVVNIQGPVNMVKYTINDGTWIATGLPAGTYTVTYQNITGRKFTIQDVGSNNTIDSDVSSNGSVTAIVYNGSVHTNIDAGYIVDNVISGPILSVDIYYDANANGIRDSAETNITNIGFTVYSVSGSAETLYGTYTADTIPKNVSVSSGNYVVYMPAISGYPVFTAGIVANSRSAVLSVTSQTNLSVGVTTSAASLNSIQGTVFRDANNNGVLDESLTGNILGGVPVYLYLANNLTNIHMQTTSNTNGIYTFSGLSSGTQYKIKVNPPTGYAYTVYSSASGGSDIYSDGWSSTITPSGLITKNIGFVFVGSDVPIGGYGTLYGRIYMDYNGNGIYDSTDTVMGGGTVALYEVPYNGARVYVYNTSISSSGIYSLTGLAVGNYEIVVTPPAGITFTDGSVTYTKSVYYYNVTGQQEDVVKAFAVGGTNPATRVSIGDYVWFDSDADGIQDSNESGVGNVQLELYSVSGTTTTYVKNTYTTSEGRYIFDQLVPGVYRVKVMFPTNRYPTMKYGGSVTVDSNFDTSGWSTDITLYSGVDLSIDCGLYSESLQSYSDTVASDEIRGVVWNDEDEDGKTDNGEISIRGAVVTLYRYGTGEEIDDVKTDRNGLFSFTGLTPGQYRVTIEVSEEGSWVLKGSTNSRGIVSTITPGSAMIMAAYVYDEDVVSSGTTSSTNNPGIIDGQTGPAEGYWPGQYGTIDISELPGASSGSGTGSSGGGTGSASPSGSSEGSMIVVDDASSEKGSGTGQYLPKTGIEDVNWSSVMLVSGYLSVLLGLVIMILSLRKKSIA